MLIRAIFSTVLLGGAVAIASPAAAGVLGGNIGLGGSASGGLGGNIGMTHGSVGATPSGTAIHSDASTRHASASTDGSVSTGGTATNAVDGAASAATNTANGAVDAGLATSVSGNTSTGAATDHKKDPQGTSQHSANADGASSSSMQTQSR